MAFEGLAEKLQAVFGKLTRRGKLSEADIKAAMREVRLALDVYKRQAQAYLAAGDGPLWKR